ncbi:endonuclease [Bacillus sp. B15-48]|nr:endonuclease [Bacillus sp. B15-48]
MGADLTPLIGAPANEIPDRLTAVFRHFLATNFPVRVKAIARQIALAKPDFIGLQEAERWQLEIPNLPIVTFDFVSLLLAELRSRGLHYEIAAENRNFLGRLPDSNGNTIQVLDRDVILNRKGRHVKIINRQEANFNTNLTVPLGGQPFVILRGWSSIDVMLRGHIFRMINTHLEPASAEIRNAQAQEILEGPANTNLPLIITGDLNSPPDGTAYTMFINAGFQDVWSGVGEDFGFTCCQGPDLLNAVSQLTRRIDYILFKNDWVPIKADVIGDSQSDRTKTGLWPSDHAGVSATFDIGVSPPH